jgi:hypothetical protein
VGKCGGGFLRANGATVDFPRLTLSVSIDKHGAPRLAEPLGKFGSKLMTGDNLGVLAGKRLGKQPASVPTEPVIAPQRIPVADDNHAAHSLQLSALSFHRRPKADR